MRESVCRFENVLVHSLISSPIVGVIRRVREFGDTSSNLLMTKVGKTSEK